EQLYLLTSNGTEGHVPVHCTDGLEFYSNSGPHSPVVRDVWWCPLLLIFLCSWQRVVLRIPEFCLDKVSTLQRTRMTEFITGCKTTAPVLPDKTYR
ncbi:unnamed protein product, partial [Cyprideis torosa]